MWPGKHQIKTHRCIANLNIISGGKVLTYSIQTNMIPIEASYKPCRTLCWPQSAKHYQHEVFEELENAAMFHRHLFHALQQAKCQDIQACKYVGMIAILFVMKLLASQLSPEAKEMHSISFKVRRPAKKGLRAQLCFATWAWDIDEIRETAKWI